MMAIDELDYHSNCSDSWSHNELVENIDYLCGYKAGSVSFSNSGDSDFVLAHVGRLVSVVRRATPYTDFEIKMNMALKGIQGFDFNRMAVYNMNRPPRTNARRSIISRMVGEYGWDTLCFRGVRYSAVRGLITVTNSLGVLEQDGRRTVLYAPVVRLDKFADFRKNNMFSGQINWSETVSYWINKDFMTKEGAIQNGIEPFYKLWKTEFLKELRLKQFRIEHVENTEINKLIYTPEAVKVASLAQLREESKQLLTETRNVALVLNKSQIMQRLSLMDRDYAAEFIAQHANDNVQNAPTAQVTDTAQVLAAANWEEAIESASTGLAGTATWGVAAAAARAARSGIIQQIEQEGVIPPLYNSHPTLEEISRMVDQIDQISVRRPEEEASEPPSLIDPASPELTNQAGVPVQPEQPEPLGYVHISSRGFGRTLAQQQALYLREVAERERREVAQRAAETRENEARQRIMERYPHSEADAFQETPIERAQRQYEQLIMQVDSMVDSGHRPPSIPTLESWLTLDNRTRHEFEEAVRITRRQFDEHVRQSIAYYGTPGDMPVDDTVISMGMAFIAQQRDESRQQSADEMLSAMTEEFIRQRSSRIANEAIAAEQEEEDLYIAGIDPFDAIEDELEQEARELQRTLEPQNHDNTSPDAESAGDSEDSNDNSSDVSGGGPAFSEEETEIF